MRSVSFLVALLFSSSLVAAGLPRALPDAGVAVSGRTVHLPVLRNDGVAATAAATSSLAPAPGACFLAPASSPLPPPPSPARVRFADATVEAGVRGTRPQKSVKTSPNCAFDQYDGSREAWDAGTFCMPEILTGGAGTGDVNGDGRHDLYVARLEGPDSLYLNNGDGTFTDATADSGLLAMTADVKTNGVAIFDADNDGDADIYITTLGDARFYLYINDGTGHFSEEAIERGADLTRPEVGPGRGGLTAGFSVAVGDYDQDGWLDLYTTEWFPRLDSPEYLRDLKSAMEMTTCRLLRNRGAEGPHLAGHFEDVTWAAGLRLNIGGRGVEVGNRMTSERWFAQEMQEHVRNVFSDAGLEPDEVDRRQSAINEQAERLFKDHQERGLMVADVLRKLQGDSNGLKPYQFPAIYMNFPFVGAFQFGVRFGGGVLGGGCFWRRSPILVLTFPSPPFHHSPAGPVRGPRQRRVAGAHHLR
jgi:hypothetical protein